MPPRDTIGIVLHKRSTFSRGLTRGPCHARFLPVSDLFDVTALRAQFPALSARVHGHLPVYLDSAASAQKPQRVIDALTQAYSGHYGNVHRGVHTQAAHTTDAYEAAREHLRAFLNARHPDEIIVTSGATGGLNLAAHAFGAALQPGDEVLVSLAEHHSNFVPWYMLCRRSGAVLRTLPVDAHGGVDTATVLKHLSPRTKILALTHMSNVTGGRTDLAAITTHARAQGIITVADGAQAAVHGPVDVQHLGIDAYAITGHKLYGPTGVGVLYLRREAAADLPPFLGGGEMIESVSPEHVTYAEPPHRFEAGTPPIAPFIALGEAVRFLTALGPEAFAHETAVHRRAEAALRDLGCTIYGDAPHKGPITAFNIPGVHPLDAASFLDLRGIAVRAGRHCAEPLLQSLGQHGTLRASFAVYNTFAEVDALSEGILACQKALR